jgi:hypothetical protein
MQANKTIPHELDSFFSYSEIADFYILEQKLKGEAKNLSRRPKDNIYYFLDMLETAHAQPELAIYGLYLSCFGNTAIFIIL